MIRCLLFGHAPHPLLEFGRINQYRMTFCERCGENITHLDDTPLPNGSMTLAERDAMLVDNIVARLDERYAKRRRRRSKPSSDSSKSGDPARVLGGAQ